MSTAARIEELRIKFADNPRRYFAPLANELRKAGNQTEAIALCREFLPRQPEHMSGYIVFGQALHESGEWAEARTVFEQALALDPENLKALRHLGDIARLEGDTASARRWYERVLEADPRNDDIAAQLATLTTAAAVPTPPRAALPVSGVTPAMPHGGASHVADGRGFEVGTIEVEVGPVDGRRAEPDPLELETSFDSSAGTAFSAAARDGIPLLDLDAMESTGVREASAPASLDEPMEGMRPDASTPPDGGVLGIDSGTFDVEVSVPAVISEAPTDDPFGFSELVADEEAFEEGLLAPEWLDTTALIERMDSPRGPALPVAPATIDVVEAFGTEPGDPVHIPLEDSWVEPTDEPVDGSQLALAAPDAPVDAPVVDETVFEDVVHQESPMLAEEPPNEVAAAPAHVDVPENGSGQASAAAFVTETMGELLVAQGFTSRAITVYEELVSRRPYDPVLASRLSELQDRLANELAPLVPRLSTPSWTPALDAPAPVEAVAEGNRFTARDRFARLAARRVPRRTPPRASVAVPADGMASLFSGEPSGSDDQAARALADAFAPIDLEPDGGARLPFDISMLSGTARAETPVRSATPLGGGSVAEPAADPFSFDRFFPDPATAIPSTLASPARTPVAPTSSPTASAEMPPATVSDDLAQFSAWLKGLGDV